MFTFKVLALNGSQLNCSGAEKPSIDSIVLTIASQLWPIAMFPPQPSDMYPSGIEVVVEDDVVVVDVEDVVLVLVVEEVVVVLVPSLGLHPFKVIFLDNFVFVSFG
jgi:hypothetical protein